jgi:hypothetical protein
MKKKTTKERRGETLKSRRWCAGRYSLLPRPPLLGPVAFGRCDRLVVAGEAAEVKTTLRLMRGRRRWARERKVEEEATAAAKERRRCWWR